MEFEVSDSSGTDDDLPPSLQNKFRSGGTASFHQIQNDMEVHIHHIEQEAYSSVLRAFKAQSDAISWEMESLITELRKELRVTDEEHRKLLSRVNADDMIGRIREWRKVNGLPPDMLKCRMASASYKKQKTSFGPPPLEPPSSALKQVSGSASRVKKPESYASKGFTDRDQVPKQGFGGPLSTKELNEDNNSDPLIGRKVWTRWPEDNNFFEAVISDFNPSEGRHALVYDTGTPNEARKWVNLREISPDYIRWKREDIGLSHRGDRNWLGPGVKKIMAHGGTIGGSGKASRILKGQSKKEVTTSQNGIQKKGLNDIEIFHTDTLVKEVDKVFNSSHADPMDIEKARKVLKEHEQALIDAITKLEGISDGESDRERHPLSQLQTQPIFVEKLRKNEVGEGSNGNKSAKDARNGPNKPIRGDNIP